MTYSEHSICLYEVADSLQPIAWHLQQHGWGACGRGSVPSSHHGQNVVSSPISLHRTVRKGFLPSCEYSDEIGQEGATEFVDIEGGGLGEGEGAKDVSDQIESEDQLDEARRPDEEKSDQPEHQPDIAPEDNAIEMSEDFDGKPQDLEPVEGNDVASDNEEEMEKQMGDVDGPDDNRLDEQMWASDEEEDDSGKEQLSGNEGGGERMDEEKNQEKSKERKPHELDQIDEPEYDEDRVDPNHGDQNQQQEPEQLDLPDDLNLDQDEEDEGAGDEGEGLPNQPEDVCPIEDMEEKVPEEGKDNGDDKEEKQGEEKDKDGEDNTEERKEDSEELAANEEPQEQNTVDDQDEGQQTSEEKDDINVDECAVDESQKQQEEDENKKGENGFAPQEQDKDLTGPENPDVQQDEQEIPERAEEHGWTSHDTACAMQSEAAEDQIAGQEETQEKQGVGTANPNQQEGHQGSVSATATESRASQENRQVQRKPGQSKSDRSLGNADEQFRRLKTTDKTLQQPVDEKDEKVNQADVYEHITEDVVHADAQTIDAATAQQQNQQKINNKLEDEDESNASDTDMQVEEKEEDNSEVQDKIAKNPSKKQPREANQPGKEESMEVGKIEVAGSKVLTLGAERPPESTIHTQLEHLSLDIGGQGVDIEKLRNQLEDSMSFVATSRCI
ncbi:midasin-like [Pomacea canaliculata]|uniref:midasin-like n=1 Tax=Pomacea canaliculata TaxID=400727 RepID=UPI000D738A73|nr:midasin-like [Pomacea canaliculata]